MTASSLACLTPRNAIGIGSVGLEPGPQGSPLFFCPSDNPSSWALLTARFSVMVSAASLRAAPAAACPRGARREARA